MLMGDSERECLGKNTWSGTAPKCILPSRSGKCKKNGMLLQFYRILFLFCYSLYIPLIGYNVQLLLRVKP